MPCVGGEGLCRRRSKSGLRKAIEAPSLQLMASMVVELCCWEIGEGIRLWIGAKVLEFGLVWAGRGQGARNAQNYPSANQTRKRALRNAN